MWRRDRGSARDAAALLVELPPRKESPELLAAEAGAEELYAPPSKPRPAGSDRASSGTPFHLLPLDEAEVEGRLPREDQPPPVDRPAGAVSDVASLHYT